MISITRAIIMQCSSACCCCRRCYRRCSAAAHRRRTLAKRADKAQLFTVPQEQMAHIQIVTVAPTSISRSLRLTGAVAFNAFNTTPVITQIGGPVSRIVVTPGQQVRRGEPLLYVASPDYSQLLANYLKARDAFNLADKKLSPFERPLRSPCHCRTRSGSSRIGAHAGIRRPRRGRAVFEDPGNFKT